MEHHFAGLKRFLGDDNKAEAIRQSLEVTMKNCRVRCDVLTSTELAALHYAFKLTRTPSELTENDIETLRDAGLSDGEILEINQVTAYFSYANRTVLGLGCSTDGDVLGLSPNNSENEDDWGHQ